MQKTVPAAFVITAGLVALAAIDLVGLAGLRQADLVLASIGAFPVLALGAFALVPMTRSSKRPSRPRLQPSQEGTLLA